MKKLMFYTAAAWAVLPVSMAFAQTKGFEGFSLALSANYTTSTASATSNNQTPAYDYTGIDIDSNWTAQAQYNVLLNNALLLGIGGTADLGDIKAGRLQNANQIKRKEAYSLYLAPSYAITKDWLAYVKFAYLKAESPSQVRQVTFDNGYGIGLGMQKQLGEHVFVQAEYMMNQYNDKLFPLEKDKLKANIFSLGLGYKF